MLPVTLGGIFIVSALIGVLNTGIEGKLDELRKGRSLRHRERTTPSSSAGRRRSSPIISRAGASPTRTSGAPRIVDPGRARQGRDGGRDPRPRSADTGSTRDRLPHRQPRSTSTTWRSSTRSTARSIIVLAPESDDPDSQRDQDHAGDHQRPATARPEPYHIVAEIRDAKQPARSARLVGGDEAQLVLAGDLISRIIAQTCRQSGPVGGLHRAARLRRRRDLLRRGARAGRARPSARRCSPTRTPP